MALRSDIDGISEQEFSDLIDEISGKKTNPKKPRAKKSPGPADDRPVTRIAHLLRVKLGLSDQQATSSLREALLEAGVRADAIPNTAESLETWLDRLLDNVADSKVMTIAKKIKATSC